MRGALALALLPVLAGPAAACPTGADLSAGIILTGEDGSTETMSLTPEGAVQSWYFWPPDQTTLTQLAGGYLPEMSMNFTSAVPDLTSRVSYALDLPEGGLPAPAPGLRVDVPMTTTDASGSSDETVEIAFGDHGTYRIGGCSYDAIPLALSYDDYREFDIYLPALGFSVVIGTADADGSNPEGYGYTGITVATGPGSDSPGAAAPPLREPKPRR